MVCTISTDKSEYKIGETIKATYENAPKSSAIHILKYPGGEAGTTATVTGSGTFTHVLGEYDPLGTWEIGLFKMGECETLKYVTVEAANGCDQRVLVLKPDGSVAAGATVVRDLTEEEIVGPDGKVTIRLKVGRTHSIYAKMEGYSNSTFYTIESACEPLITLSLRPPSEYCYQMCGVYELDPFNFVVGARVSYAGESCITDETGTCRLKVERGIPFRATATKDGYEDGESQEVVACEQVEVAIYLTRKEEAKGEITLCNINGLSCPNNGEANPGDEISVIAEMKNVGTEKGKFMFYVLDQDGNELSKAGGIGYKDVKAGETWKVTPKSLDDLDFKMPTSAIIKGELKLSQLE